MRPKFEMTAQGSVILRTTVEISRKSSARKKPMRFNA